MRHFSPCKLRPRLALVGWGRFFPGISRSQGASAFDASKANDCQENQEAQAGDRFKAFKNSLNGPVRLQGGFGCSVGLTRSAVWLRLGSGLLFLSVCDCLVRFVLAADDAGAFGSCQWRLITFVSACRTVEEIAEPSGSTGCNTAGALIPAACPRSRSSAHRALPSMRRCLLEPRHRAYRDAVRFPKTVPERAMRREAHRRGKSPPASRHF